MIRTVHIDDTNLGAKALLDYLSTLDFVKVETNDFELTEEHISILNQRRDDHLAGKSKSHSWDEVKERARSAK
jgi:hypothetical protein